MKKCPINIHVDVCFFRAFLIVKIFAYIVVTMLDAEKWIIYCSLPNKKPLNYNNNYPSSKRKSNVYLEVLYSVWLELFN